jgi:MFS transporter, FHS family, glucose/mannose:H+ symporter
MLTIVSYLAFFSVGSVTGLFSAVVPAIMAELHIPLAQAALVFSSMEAGSLIAVLGCGPLMDRFGKKRFLIAGCALVVLGAFLPLWGRSFAMLISGTVAEGMGMGLLSIGFNALVIDLNVNDPSRRLNTLNFFYSAGAFIGPSFVVASRFAGLEGFRPSLAFCAVVPLLLIPFLAKSRFPRPNPRPSSSGRSRRGLAAALRDPATLVGALGLFCYAGWEIGISSGLATYVEATGTTSFLATSAAFASAFWISLALGRIAGSLVVNAIGTRAFLGGSVAGGSIVALSWIIFPSAGMTMAAAVLLGLFAGGVYPTTMALVGGARPEATGSTTTVLSLGGSLGCFLLPPLFGAATDTWGTSALPRAILAACVSTGLVIILLFRVMAARGTNESARLRGRS